VAFSLYAPIGLSFPSLSPFFSFHTPTLSDTPHFSCLHQAGNWWNVIHRRQPFWWAQCSHVIAPCEVFTMSSMSPTVVAFHLNSLLSPALTYQHPCNVLNLPNSSQGNKWDPQTTFPHHYEAWNGKQTQILQPQLVTVVWPKRFLVPQKSPKLNGPTTPTLYPALLSFCTWILEELSGSQLEKDAQPFMRNAFGLHHHKTGCGQAGPASEPRRVCHIPRHSYFLYPGK
jgi:hypothetical protein